MSRPTPRHTLAHLSDLHLTGDGSGVGGVVEPRERLEAALAVLTSWRLPVDAWVFSGDLSDDGSPASYAWLHDRVADAAAQVGAAVVWGNGNHDEVGAFRAGLGLRGWAAVNTETFVRGLRILTVDSNLAGVPEGLVTVQTLAWLDGRLDAAAPAGTVLVVHHAPVPQPQDAAHLWPLLNADALAEVVRGRDVRVILSGHFHQTGFGTLAGVPVAMATSLAYTQDVGVSPDLRGQAAHTGFNLVELYDSSVVVTAVPLDPGVGVHEVLTSEDVRGRLAFED